MKKIERVHILLEEYRALYSILLHRMQFLERRVPLIGVTLAAFLCNLAALPPKPQIIFLMGIPTSLLWFLRTTLSHIRSREDLVRRLDEIERQINLFAGEELISFQSRHPSRNRVGGRTGTETSNTVYYTCLSLLAACAYLRVWPLEVEYLTYLAVMALYLTYCMVRMRSYEFDKQAGDGAPLVVQAGLEK